MKPLFMLAFMAVLSVTSFAQSTSLTAAVTEPQPMIVEASCGTCNFHAKADGCSLFVRIDGKAYAVSGYKIDDFGDAHGDAGMCQAIRKAEVTGDIKGEKFYAKTFKLLPVEKPKQ